jgi:hypothetical protein
LLLQLAIVLTVGFWLSLALLLAARVFHSTQEDH